MVRYGGYSGLPLRQPPKESREPNEAKRLHTLKLVIVSARRHLRSEAGWRSFNFSAY
jgi:hypothetical protein